LTDHWFASYAVNHKPDVPAWPGAVQPPDPGISGIRSGWSRLNHSEVVHGCAWLGSRCCRSARF